MIFFPNRYEGIDEIYFELFLAEDDGKEVLAVYGYRFTRHNLAGVGVESRWLCVQPGCFTTIFTDMEDNINMFGWPYHSHPPQLYTGS